jgi:hypothetical protein
MKVKWNSIKKKVMELTDIKIMTFMKVINLTNILKGFL